MQEFVKIAKAIVFIITGLLISDFVIGKSMTWLMTKLPDHGSEICEVNFAMNRACPEILILGSSRANHHYNCRLIADKFGKNVYNAGIDGTNLLYSRCVLQRVLERTIPDLVILELNVGCLFNGNTVDIKHCRLFADTNTLFEQVVCKYDMSQCLYINAYRYNSSILNILSNVFLRRNNRSDGNGFVPLANTNLYSGSDWEYRNINGTLNKNTVDEFILILDIAKAYGFGLVVASSPVRFMYNSDNTSTETVKHLCDEYGVIFLDNSQLPYFKKHDEYIKDANHLTGDGADVYTNYFLNQLDYVNMK